MGAAMWLWGVAWVVLTVALAFLLALFLEGTRRVTTYFDLCCSCRGPCVYSEGWRCCVDGSVGCFDVTDVLEGIL